MSRLGVPGGGSVIVVAVIRAGVVASGSPVPAMHAAHHKHHHQWADQDDEADDEERRDGNSGERQSDDDDGGGECIQRQVLALHDDVLPGVASNGERASRPTLGHQVTSIATQSPMQPSSWPLKLLLSFRVGGPGSGVARRGPAGIDN
ncbi:exported hypothetical protein [uncultured Mycobacterium sp.]|uniref:Uncharacterized protein n=1 Tax=uncultured Mycobacterium sp. TaxID=171292 RepID=A0A1Y5PJL5_9MYCO|nr:exported hypothetical protein [uncultured Mycobacterium sp.]